MVTVEAGTAKYVFQADHWDLLDGWLHVNDGTNPIAVFPPGNWEQAWKTESKVDT